jgi:hypothetical protein
MDPSIISYLLTQGGLAESPRNAHALELESTFRMARLKEQPI